MRIFDGDGRVDCHVRVRFVLLLCDVCYGIHDAGAEAPKPRHNSVRSKSSRGREQGNGAAAWLLTRQPLAPRSLPAFSCLFLKPQLAFDATRRRIGPLPRLVAMRISRPAAVLAGPHRIAPSVRCSGVKLRRPQLGQRRLPQPKEAVVTAAPAGALVLLCMLQLLCVERDDLAGGGRGEVRGDDSEVE